jgi:hypothetical protein
MGVPEDPDASRFEPLARAAIELDPFGRLARRTSTASAERIQAPRPD